MSAVDSAPAPVHELLARFVLPTHAILKDVIVVENYRGDFTESGDRRLRTMLGEKYDSLHFDTVACDGRVVIYLPRFKLPGATAIRHVHAPQILTAPHHWALTQVDERSPEVTHASAATIQRVPVEISRDLHALPELEFVDVRDVHFWVHGNGPAKKKKKPAPRDVVYFRFAGGYGVVLARALGGAAS